VDRWGELFLEGAKHLAGRMGVKSSPTGNDSKTTMIVILLIPVIIVFIFVSIIQMLFQFMLCTASFGMICTDDDSSFEMAITDKEIKKIYVKMKSVRAKANDEAKASGGTPGDYYKLMSPGGFGPGSGADFATCGPYSGEYADYFNAKATKYKIDPQLIAAVAKQESGIRHIDSDGSVIRNNYSGATGMMQLMPATANWLGVDPFDLEQNIEGGAKYISMMLNERNGDLKLALASYNWGPGNVNKELARLGVTTWEGVIAAGGGNSETNKYVSNITGFYEGFKKEASGCAEMPIPSPEPELTPAPAVPAASVEEAEIHLRTLIAIDEYAVRGLDKLTKKELETGKYKDTVLGDMWKIAKKRDKKHKDWTISDRLLDARTLVYQCYLVGDEEKLFDFFSDDPCEELDEYIYGSASGGNYIHPNHRKMLAHMGTQVVEEYECVAKPEPPKEEEPPIAEEPGPSVPPPYHHPGPGGPQPVPYSGKEADADYALGKGGTPEGKLLNHTNAPKLELGPKSCEANEDRVLKSTKTVKSIAYPNLTTVLKEFKPYSMAVPNVTLINDDADTPEGQRETHDNLVDFYLGETYKDFGFSGDYQSVAPIITVGDGTLGYPLKSGLSRMSSPFGGRDGTHKGVDFGEPRGTEVLAIEAGTVVDVRTGANGSQGYGNLIIIKHTINGQTMYSKYGHLLNNALDCPACIDGGSFPGSKSPKEPYDYYDEQLRIQVKVGDTVPRGQVIAYVGNAASSTNFHLHLELCGATYDKSTCIDPVPYMRD